MTQAFVSIGSNIARESNIRSGVTALRHAFGRLQISSVYESKAEGFAGDPFYNLVVGFEAADMAQVEHVLHEIEASHGRRRGAEKFSPRTLDLDLILFGDAVLHDEGKDIPRAEITRYSFVLWPLAEIAPDLQHPQLAETYADLWARFKQDNATKLADIHPVRFNF